MVQDLAVGSDLVCFAGGRTRTLGASSKMTPQVEIRRVVLTRASIRHISVVALVLELAWAQVDVGITHPIDASIS